MIVYIHGANATGSSFNYLRDHLKYDDLVIEYDSNNGFMNNVNLISDRLKDIDEMFFICHSLGGIYALHLSEIFADKILGAVTLSTPYNGAECAEYAKHFWPNHRLFRDIGPSSEPIKRSKEISIPHPWTNVVSTSGSNPLIIYPNDGVVTINSMKCRNDMTLIEIPVNHYEVVLSPLSLEIIQGELNGLR
jgi:pimeloyl-ACP methyl ester carboxylesterase